MLRVLLCLLLFAGILPANATERPNVLWITAEDLSPHLGCYGDKEAHTPRLDALAPPRICAPGMAQFPGLFWSHDGTRPLAALVRWRDLG